MPNWAKGEVRGVCVTRGARDGEDQRGAVDDFPDAGLAIVRVAVDVTVIGTDAASLAVLAINAQRIAPGVPAWRVAPAPYSRRTGRTCCSHRPVPPA